ncbi:MAG: hypothetical protein AAFV93_23990, partial [Chloroflexota bacterium]
MSYSLIVLLILAACQPTVPAGPPTEIPFPTVTVGQRVTGNLTTPSARSGVLPVQFGDERTS